MSRRYGSREELSKGKTNERRIEEVPDTRSHLRWGRRNRRLRRRKGNRDEERSKVDLKIE